MESVNNYDRVNAMIDQAESYSVKFKEFINTSSKYPESIVCLFEGQDEKYYSSRLNMKFGNEGWRGINTGGRGIVLEIQSIIEDHGLYSSRKYLCFIDHDFQDWFVNHNPERIYVTPCYSIENLYVTEQSFRRILHAEFNITEFNESSNEYFKCIQLFGERLDEFVSVVYTFNCWAKAHRIMEHRNKNITKMNLKNVKFKHLAQVELYSVRSNYDLTNPLSVFRDAINIDWDETAIAEADQSFDIKNLAAQFRGEQQLEFLKAFIMKLKIDRTSKTPQFFEKSENVTLNLSANCISELSQYADTPNCLHAFLDLSKQRFGIGV